MGRDDSHPNDVVPGNGWVSVAYVVRDVVGRLTNNAEAFTYCTFQHGRIRAVTHLGEVLKIVDCLQNIVAAVT